MATVAASTAASSERRFFSWSALVMLALVLAGFAPSYYLSGVLPPAPGFKSMTPLVHLHGMVFSTWLLLFVTQTQLVAFGRTDLHRRLGLAAFVLLPIMIVVATLTSLHGVARDSGPPIVPPLSWLAVPLLDIPVFALLIGGALANRRTPAAHKRLMFVAMVGMMGPAIGRLPLPPPFVGPIAIFGLPDLFLLALAAFDFARLRRIHWATWGGGLLLVGSQVFRIAVWQTEGWLRFAGWAAGLVA